MSISMKMILILLFAGIVVSKAADNAPEKQEALNFVRALTVRNDLTKDARSKKLEVYLKSLDKSTFLEFLREVDRAQGIFKGEEDKQLSMFFFAKWYLESLGEHDDLLINLALLKNRALPWRWRWALLDILKPEEKLNITMVNVATITKILRDVSKDSNENDNLRYSLLEKNASILITQLELVAKKVPSLKQRIMAQDQSVLQETEIQSTQKMLVSTSLLLEEGKVYEEHLKMISNDHKKVKLQTRSKALLKEWQSLGGKPE